MSNCACSQSEQNWSEKDIEEEDDGVNASSNIRFESIHRRDCLVIFFAKYVNRNGLKRIRDEKLHRVNKRVYVWFFCARIVLGIF